MTTSIKTPIYSHLSAEDFERIYSPSEDTFLLIDAIESDLPFINQFSPSVCLELGVGAGLVITALGTCLRRSCKYYGTDINPYACDKALKTAQINGVHLETFVGDLNDGIPDLVKGTIDILLFNPPYVPTKTEEIASGDLELTWVGDEDGREVIDRLLPKVYHIFSPKSIFFLLLEGQNKPLEVVQIMNNYGFKHELIIERKVRNELLSVFKFSK